jgi:hypothetical protein
MTPPSPHASQEELVLHAFGEAERPAELESHVAECEECRGELEAVRRTLEAVAVQAAPERDADYGSRVWQRLEPRLRAHDRARRARRLWVPAALAASLVLAFVLGRHTAPTPTAGASQPVRDRILLVALGDHLERSQMVLVELVNAHAAGPADVHREQEWAQSLLAENRLYRQALARSDAAGIGGGVLEELERVLIEIANGPSKLSARQLKEIQERIESRGILFKMRVVGRQVKQKSQDALVETRVIS